MDLASNLPTEAEKADGLEDLNLAKETQGMFAPSIYL